MVPDVSARWRSSSDFIVAVLLVSVLAGTLDLIAAHLHGWAISGRFPTYIFKGIASGLFGRERAFHGGFEMIAIGAFSHYLISFAFTLLFFLGAERAALLRTHVGIVGSVYALVVWSVMNLMVLPLSALSASLPDFTSASTYVGMVILVVALGIPTAAGARFFFRGRV